jgi:acyl-ACP thioesterase
VKVNIKKDGFDFSLGLGDILVTDNNKMYMVIEDSKADDYPIRILNIETNTIVSYSKSLDVIKDCMSKGFTLSFGDDGIHHVREIIKSKDLVLDIQR